MIDFYHIKTALLFQLVCYLMTGRTSFRRLEFNQGDFRHNMLYSFQMLMLESSKAIFTIQNQ